MFAHARLFGLAAALAAGWLAAPALAASKCGGHDDIVKALGAKFQEQRRALGIVSNTTVMEVFLSPKGTWTMLVTNTQGQSCIVAAGEEWQDVPGTVAGLDS